METPNIDNQATNINPAINNQLQQTPTQKNNNPIIIILCLIIIILVGVSAYLYGVNQGKAQIRSQISNDLAKVSPTPFVQNTNTPINATIPTDKPLTIDWKKETDLINFNTESMGNRNYSLEFSYPSNWSIQKTTATHENDKYTKNCVDYTLTNKTTNASVVINLICDGWSSTYFPYPSNSEVIQKMEKQGNDGHTTYRIRYFSFVGNIYRYADASVLQGEVLNNTTKIMDVVLISYAPDDWYFIPVKLWLSAPSGVTISESDKTIADAIIKSLKLSRVN